ncbi:MAG TPA: phosphoenolpyruvate synthase [Steroidobacteraceae bacterium]|nr:phosphoenolpyruvate synthase [Steroidobacteraceae bacterium]
MAIDAKSVRGSLAQGRASAASDEIVLWLDDPRCIDVSRVGGKNASLANMTCSLAGAGIRVPPGFATTAGTYRSYLQANRIEEKLRDELAAYHGGRQSLAQTGAAIRKLIVDAEFPAEIAGSILAAHRTLATRCGATELAVAVRSSATAEDLPQASFAGQQETFLNVRGESDLLLACRKCYASLFTDRAIVYRETNGFDHLQVALSIGIQRMVRADRAGAGVAFTLDTETGFPGVVVVSAAWGLGENVVQGTVTPDKYVVFKPLLQEPRYRPIIEIFRGDKEKKLVYGAGSGAGTQNIETTLAEREALVLREEEILQLARWGVAVEKHYGRPMDIEWAKDGDTGEIFLVQARPETVQSGRSSTSMRSYSLVRKGKRIVTGAAIGESIATGPACVLHSAREIDQFRDGSILVTESTDPDWVPIMKKAAGLITNFGGNTSHAAIVSRELGVPAIVGTLRGTELIADSQPITLCCAEGETGAVYDGILEFKSTDINLAEVPQTRTAMMVNIASPAAAFRWWRLPAKGIGLARMEFIINNIIRVHPMALVHFEGLKDAQARAQIEALTRGFPTKSAFFVDTLARGIAKIAAPHFPNPVIVRLSDFKSNEYAHLIGGAQFELSEENPMLGLRGASRYYSAHYQDGFALECQAIRKAREELGFANLIVMVPFCRTPREADQVLAVMGEHGLRRGKDGLQVYVMCEIPSNVILAEEFAARFDGFSIGSNDLTQLILGVDRDSAELAGLFDERDAAVKRMIADVIERAHRSGTKVGICGQAPSNYPDFAAFLVECGIDSISLNPDSFVATTQFVAAKEKART